MIVFEKNVLPSPEQILFVIEGMRNPMNSWYKSDSFYSDGTFKIGPNDKDLMRRLNSGGADDRKFLRQLPVGVRITAPLYWGKEFDTYKIGTTANSCSTMHKIQEKEFTLEDFSHDHLDEVSMPVLGSTILALNNNRDKFLSTNDKQYWWNMIQLLPSSYNQTRNVTLNYEVLKNMYHARKAHKLDEWRVGFCKWVESLPYSELITNKQEN